MLSGTSKHDFRVQEHLRNKINFCAAKEDRMGELVDPSRREKYSKEELVNRIQTYESIQDEINKT